jgi:hypothetical protein
LDWTQGLALLGKPSTTWAVHLVLLFLFCFLR